MERASKFGRPTSVESTEGIEARIAMIEGRYEDALAHWTAMREHLTRRHGDSGSSGTCGIVSRRARSNATPR